MFMPSTIFALDSGGNQKSIFKIFKIKVLVFYRAVQPVFGQKSVYLNFLNNELLFFHKINIGL